jgi:hypothetical protein
MQSIRCFSLFVVRGASKVPFKVRYEESLLVSLGGGAGSLAGSRLGCRHLGSSCRLRGGRCCNTGRLARGCDGDHSSSGGSNSASTVALDLECIVCNC